MLLLRDCLIDAWDLLLLRLELYKLGWLRGLSIGLELRGDMGKRSNSVHQNRQGASNEDDSDNDKGDTPS